MKTVISHFIGKALRLNRIRTTRSKYSIGLSAWQCGGEDC